ncbi:MAG TPA: hypothetical protein VK601_22935 [Kofleriaceae bacterium]|nr:hypothetical protein [Kofleriaceae bacterium]
MRTANLALRLATLATLGAAAACGTAATKAVVPPAEITLTVTSPAPGAELGGSEHGAITVSGTVATTNPRQGALEAWVNGVRVDVVNGAFTTELAPEVGINHLKIEGGDGIGALVGQQLDVMWAPEYLAPLPGQTGFDLAGAIELRLGQRFFDTRLLGTTLDRSTDPVVARDIASALELILWHIDLAALVPGGIHVGQGDASLDLTIGSATPSNIVVDARIVDGPAPAIELQIDLLGVFLATSGSFTFGGNSLVVAGGITADLQASARLTLGTAADGSIAVAVTDVAASVGPLTPGFTGADGDQLDALITIGNTEFRGLIESLLGGDLIPTFTDRLPPLLEQVLDAADQLLDGLEFTLDTGVGRPVTLQLDGHMGGLGVAAGATSGHVTVRQDLSVRTTGAPIHPASRGAPRLDTSTADPVLNTSGLHLTMREDFLNALLHSLWNAGLLEGPLSSGGLSATISAKLPPVIRPTPASSPCEIDGERCDVMLQLGQVEVQLADFAQSFTVNASAGARIEVHGSAVSLAIQKVPQLVVWETSTMAGGVLTPDAVSALITALVWPKLFGAIGDNLTIALPLPDLAALGLGDLAPGLASAQLVLQARQRPTITAGRLVLGADLSLSTPPPP